MGTSMFPVEFDAAPPVVFEESFSSGAVVRQFQVGPVGQSPPAPTYAA
jgi:hypothetical protein